MSYIDYTRRSSNSIYEMTVCITKEECKTLLPFFKSAYKKSSKSMISTRTFTKEEKQRKNRKIYE